MTVVMARSPAPEPSAVGDKRDRPSPFESARGRMFVPMVWPALLVYVIVMIAPTAFTIWLSANTWPGAGPMEYVGFGNYTQMVRSPVFVSSFVNTFWIVVGVGTAVFLVAFVLTMLLQDMLGRKFVRLIIFFPALVPGVAVSVLWGFLFNNDGLINSVLAKVGVDDPPPWLAVDNIFKVILLGLVWLSVGTYTVIFMAAADRIPKEFYEAAELEGAGPWQRFRYVTLPMMWDVVSVCAVLWCVGALKIFEFLLTFSGSAAFLPSTKNWNFALFSYATAFAPSGVAQFGMAAACGVLVLLLTLVLTVLARRLTRREVLNF